MPKSGSTFDSNLLHLVDLSSVNQLTELLFLYEDITAYSVSSIEITELRLDLERVIRTAEQPQELMNHIAEGNKEKIKQYVESILNTY